MLFFQQKYVSFVFYLSLSPFFSFELRWPAAHFLFSLPFSCSIFLICAHDNLSKLKTLDNTDTESISAFRFRLYWLFCCLCFTRRRWLCDFPPNILELHLGCHTCWLSYFTLLCLWCGRTVSRCTVAWLPNFLGWVHYFIFLPMVLRWLAWRARAPLKKERFNKIWITWLNWLNCLNIFAEDYIL